jgi:hypothetical protein
MTFSASFNKKSFHNSYGGIHALVEKEEADRRGRAA